jgi:small subunit ribosomal protein S2
VVADAVADGLIARAGAADGEAKPSRPAGDIGAEEPLAEWERELLEGTNEVAADVAAAQTDADGATATRLAEAKTDTVDSGTESAPAEPTTETEPAEADPVETVAETIAGEAAAGESATGDSTPATLAAGNESTSA